MCPCTGTVRWGDGVHPLNTHCVYLSGWTRLCCLCSLGGLSCSGCAPVSVVGHGWCLPADFLSWLVLLMSILTEVTDERRQHCCPSALSRAAADFGELILAGVLVCHPLPWDHWPGYLLCSDETGVLFCGCLASRNHPTMKESGAASNQRSC